MPRKSSTYKVPVTSVPDAPDGVIVTLMVVVWPLLMVIGENDADAFVAASQRSPVVEVTAGSKAFACAAIEVVEDPAARATDGVGPAFRGARGPQTCSHGASLAACRKPTPP